MGAMSAKPQEAEVLLQEDKHIIPTTQLKINTNFLISFLLNPKTTYFL